MALATSEERDFLKAISELTYCNPFTPQRLACERKALGKHFVESDSVWSFRPDAAGERENIRRLIERGEPIAHGMREKLIAGNKPARDELELYQDLVLYLLYDRYRLKLDELISRLSPAQGQRSRRVSGYAAFAKEYAHYLEPLQAYDEVCLDEPSHVFALFYQIRRAFKHIFDYIIGGSAPIARLRAEVWQSVFTHDLRRFRTTLYDKMGQVTTLITGPSGTGKELVARAVGLSRYFAFDPKSSKFVGDDDQSFHALNLTALSPTLIESELFGHKRGAFTGALQDHKGWLELCGPAGTVFLDEIGELDPLIQVKLLRLLQERTYQSLGDTATKHFSGKIIAATNRNLACEIQAGRFREDFYYRLCSDMITTPSLHEQIADSPAELRQLVQFLVKRMAGETGAEDLTGMVLSWIEKNLNNEYHWPGNFRELEQCVWNILIRNEYHPMSRAGERTGVAGSIVGVVSSLAEMKVSADDLLNAYCAIVYKQSGSYEEAARLLKLDRRTVKKRVEQQLLET